MISTKFVLLEHENDIRDNWHVDISLPYSMPFNLAVGQKYLRQKKFNTTIVLLCKKNLGFLLVCNNQLCINSHMITIRYDFQNSYIDPFYIIFNK